MQMFPHSNHIEQPEVFQPGNVTVSTVWLMSVQNTYFTSIYNFVADMLTQLVSGAA